MPTGAEYAGIKAGPREQMQPTSSAPVLQQLDDLQRRIEMDLTEVIHMLEEKLSPVLSPDEAMVPSSATLIEKPDAPESIITGRLKDSNAGLDRAMRRLDRLRSRAEL